jgi:DNA-binding HxlR family transcriptional regulator
LVEGYCWCPVTESSKIIGKKWYLVIVGRLLDGPKRFGEIEKTIPEISAKVLSDALAELELLGIVQRRVEPSRPVLIQYTLTEKGGDLKGVLSAISGWGTKWLIPSKTSTTVILHK